MNRQESTSTLGPDRRASEVRHLDMRYALPPYGTQREWEQRAAHLREQILVATGLWPLEERPRLRPWIAGRVAREGYLIEKVVLETLPGFYLCGNLFRPQGKQEGLPGILTPHGHTPPQVGRLDHAEAVGATMAGLGCVTFAWDMVGFVDTYQVGHQFGGRREALWGLSLMGLQLWNSLRAADFLTSLPYVDPARIGCTGASGGGTQTFMLAAVDDRISVSVPVVMVSATMQGGCLCENAPGLRLDTNNMEIAALAAPRPQLLVAATGDWTRETPKVEYPAVRSIYRLYGAEDRVGYRLFEGPHGFEQPSREAVYGWFAKWLLGREDREAAQEARFAERRWLDQLVWYGQAPPANRVDDHGLAEGRIRATRRALSALAPRSAADLPRLRGTSGVALRHALGAEFPRAADLEVGKGEALRLPGYSATALRLGRRGRGDAVPACLLRPARPQPGRAVLLVHAEGKAAVARPEEGWTSDLAQGCLQAGLTVLTVDAFGTGESPPPPETAYKYLDTYNRTLTANRAQDVLTALAYLRGTLRARQVAVVGEGDAGLWALLAAGLSAPEALVADLGRFPLDDDEAYLERLYVPHLRRAGGLEAAAALAYPCRTLLHNCGQGARLRWAPRLYRADGLGASWRQQAAAANISQVLRWVSPAL